MKINTWIKYTEGYLPTKRHRKLRYRECEDYINVELKEVSINDVNKKYSVDSKVYYEYNNNLYIKCNSRDISNFEIENPIENLKHCNKICSRFFGFDEDDTREKMINKAIEDINRYLLIDGKLYIETFKPFYRVYTFGLGNNHAGIGTSLSVCDRAVDYHANESFIFEVGDRKKALNYAIDTAIQRGDTDSIDYIKRTPVIVEY
jgi:hypothetical protein